MRLNVRAKSAAQCGIAKILALDSGLLHEQEPQYFMSHFLAERARRRRQSGRKTLASGLDSKLCPRRVARSWCNFLLASRPGSLGLVSGNR